MREQLVKVSFRGASGDIIFTPELDQTGGSFEIVTNVHNWDVAKGEGALASVGSYDAGTQTFRMSDDRLQHLPKERRMAICGNGILTAGQETCDDGNSNDGDGCSAQCNVEDTYTCANPTCGASTCTRVKTAAISVWETVAIVVCVVGLVLFFLWAGCKVLCAFRRVIGFSY